MSEFQIWNTTIMHGHGNIQYCTSQCHHTSSVKQHASEFNAYHSKLNLIAILISTPYPLGMIDDRWWSHEQTWQTCGLGCTRHNLNLIINPITGNRCPNQTGVVITWIIYPLQVFVRGCISTFFLLISWTEYYRWELRSEIVFVVPRTVSIIQ